VYIAYSSIQMHVSDAGNQSGWYTIADSGSIDLMSLINVSLTLGSAQVQTGVFNLISFNITSAEITLNGVNQTAYVPANRINVPIDGGVQVSAGNSSGVLVDLSPEVIPYENGTSTSYVLVPEARSLPIPAYVWNYRLEVRGAELTQIQNQTWVSHPAGNITVSGVKLTPNSFTLTLTNDGSSNATFSSVVIGSLLSYNYCPSTAASGAAPVPADGSTVSVSTLSSSYVGNSSVLVMGQVNPAPVNASSAVVVLTNPNGTVVTSTSVPISSTGSFNTTLYMIQESSLIMDGTYTVTASFNGTEGSTTFAWTPYEEATGSTSTTSSTTTYTSSTTTTSTNSTTTSSEESSSASSNSSDPVTTSTSTTETTESSSTTTSETPTSMTVLAGDSSYFGSTLVAIHGGVSPGPSSDYYWVYVRVMNPHGLVVYANKVRVSSTGQFNVTLHTGSSSNYFDNLWMNGTYTVLANHERLNATTTFQWSGPSTTETSSTETTTTYNYTETYTNESAYIGYQVHSLLCNLFDGPLRDGAPRGFPVAYFAVLSNGTLYPVNYTALVMTHVAAVYHHEENHHNASATSSEYVPTNSIQLTLAPGQSVTLTYNGPISSISPALLSYLPSTLAVSGSMFGINPGEQYTVLASGPFDTRVLTVANATAS
jgi:hypothetical protein